MYAIELMYCHQDICVSVRWQYLQEQSILLSPRHVMHFEHHERGDINQNGLYTANPQTIMKLCCIVYSRCTCYAFTEVCFTIFDVYHPLTLFAIQKEQHQRKRYTNYTLHFQKEENSLARNLEG